MKAPTLSNFPPALELRLRNWLRKKPNIIFLRFLEIKGEMRKAIGVLKKRLSDFEKTLREIEITRYGIKVGKPLTQLRGILTGVPELIHPDQ